MNEIINKFLLIEEKNMSELHLKQPGFTYSASGPFTNHRERIRNFRETGNLRYLQKNELDKACFAYDVAYCDSEDLAKRTMSDKILKDRAYENARNCKYDGYQTALPSMVYNFFDKATGSGVSEKEQLVEELHKPVIRILKLLKLELKIKSELLSIRTYLVKVTLKIGKEKYLLSVLS